jgi:DNA-binding NarL/FixJ family response regulator
VKFPDPSAPINILVADAQGILRDCLAAMLDRQPGMKVVGTAATGLDAVDAALRLQPHVITTDLVLPALNGIDVTTRILDALASTRVVILSACHTSEHVFRALRAGAHGYVLKEATAAEVVRAILSVLSGQRYLSPTIDKIRLDELLAKPNPLSPLESLSYRERQVMHLTVSGKSSAETGRILCLSQKTVDTYRSRLMAKLGVSSLTGLVHFAIANGADPLLRSETDLLHDA